MDETKMKASWSEFKQKLKDMFSTTNKDLDARIKLRNLRQGRMSVEDFNDKFLEVTSSIREISDIEQLSNYLMGLNQNLSSLVRGRGPKTLSDAIREARTLDISKEKISINYTRQVNVNNNRNFTKTNNNFNNQNKNYKRDFKNNQQEVKKCYNCSRPGHLARDCRAPKLNRNINTNLNSSNFQQRNNFTNNNNNQRGNYVNKQYNNNNNKTNIVGINSVEEEKSSSIKTVIPHKIMECAVIPHIIQNILWIKAHSIIMKRPGVVLLPRTVTSVTICLF